MSDQTPKEPEEAAPTQGAAPGEPEATHTEGAPAAEPAPAPEPGPAAPRRRGRTTALIAAAAVLGLVGGTCAGYLIQADRTPTKLPSLSQPELKQAEGEGPDPLPAAQDRKVRTDGDLRKLLLKTPKGKKEVERGWLSLVEWSSFHEDEMSSLPDELSDEFRRAATVSWQESSTRNVRISLIQFRHEATLGALKDHEAQTDYVLDGAREYPLDGAGNGAVLVLPPEREPGYMPVYQVHATAVRGDIALQLWVSDVRPVDRKKATDMAEQQLERL
ncbi:hypothetical protein [Streptomyces sp. NPDC002640]